LKEKLPGKQYISIFITFVGILLLGLAEGLAG
jgi:drug/metabolite transporter (DMT)-like permease